MRPSTRAALQQTIGLFTVLSLLITPLGNSAIANAAPPAQNQPPATPTEPVTVTPTATTPAVETVEPQSTEAPTMAASTATLEATATTPPTEEPTATPTDAPTATPTSDPTLTAVPTEPLKAFPTAAVHSPSLLSGEDPCAGPDLSIPTGVTCTLAAGSYTYNSITIADGGTLLLQGDPSLGTTGAGVTLTVTSTVSVASGGQITADYQGFTGQHGPTPGMGEFGGNGAGASHGGAGGHTWTGHGTPGQPYGDTFAPLSLGSGAGSPGGSGGGAIHLIVGGAVSVEGLITAQGATAQGDFFSGNGGAAGGSIWIEAASLSGGGTIQANGGSGTGSAYWGAGGGGGGGRVAIDVATTTFSGQATAYGGVVSASGSGSGGAGTVLWVHDDHLIVDNHDAPGSGSAAGLTEGAYQFSVIDLRNGGHLEVFGVTSALTLTSSSGAQGEGDNTLITHGSLYLPATFTVSGLTLDVYGTLNGGATMTVGGVVGTPASLILRASAPVKTFDALTIGASGTVQGVSLDNGNGDFNDDLPVEIRAGSLTIAQGGVLTADRQGYGGGRGPAAGQGEFGGNGAGASHGGAGGRTLSGHGTPGRAYGDVYAPIGLGSGGAAGGVFGGGALHLVITGTLQVEGLLTANGADSPSDFYSGNGAAAGGSIWIEAGALTGAGTLQANGGSANCSAYYGCGGGGGGGRIALSANTSAFTGAVTAYGGAPAGGARPGGAGTIYWQSTDRLVVDNANHAGSEAAAGLIEGAYHFDRIELLRGGNLEVLGATSAFTLTSETGAQGDGTGALITHGALHVPGTFTIAGLTVDAYGAIDGATTLTVGGTAGLASGLVLRRSAPQKEFLSLTVGMSGTVTAVPLNNGNTVYTDDLPLELHAGSLIVAQGGTITSDGWGYGGQQGPTPGRWAEGSNGAGASHGGRGGRTGSVTGNPGDAYGSVFEPVSLGSGAASPTEGGGGAIHLVITGTAQINGLVSANGLAATFLNTSGGGGAAGGSIWIQAASLSGSGTIQANGGGGGGSVSYGTGGGGSGGRIAINATTSGFSGAVTAYGGAVSDGSAGSGGAGTVYWTQANRLVIDNHDAPTSTSAAGLIDGAYQFALIELRHGGNLEVLGATSAMTLTSADALTGDSTGTLISQGALTLPTTFTISGVTLDPRGVIHGADTLTIGGTPGTASGLILRANTFQKVFGSLTVGLSGTVTAIPFNNGNADYSDDSPVTIQAGSVTVASGGLITTDGWGYGPALDNGTGPGGGTGNWIAYTHAAGGAHGGSGGTGFLEGNVLPTGIVYGDPKTPTTLGSAGGSARMQSLVYYTHYAGGAGGGAIHMIVSGALQVNGTITANGLNGSGELYAGVPDGSGAGSGGSLWIQAASLSGSGVIRANGGHGQFGSPESGYDRGSGGGGGRIAFDVPGFAFSGVVSTAGGIGYRKGDNGTITGMPFPRRSMRNAGLLDDVGVCPICEFLRTFGDPINSLTGAVDYNAIDLSFPALGGDVRFDRTYSTDYISIATTLGSGWTHSLDMRLILSNQPGGVTGQVLVKLHSANEFIFIEVVDPSAGGGAVGTTYQPYPGVLATLVRDGATNTYRLTTQDQGVYAFKDAPGASDHGKLLSWTDPQGHVQTYAYDSATGNLLSVTAGDRVLTITYVDGRIQSVHDHTGRSASFGYDGNGDLTTVTDVRGKTWTYAYDGASHRLTTVTDPDGKIVERNEYDATGRAWRQFNGANQLVVALTYTANPDGTTTVVATDALSHTETLTYDHLGTLVTAQSPSGAVDKAFDGNFHAQAVTDENGHDTQYLWSENGQVLTQTIDALGHDTLFQYDALNNVTRTVDARGNETTALYNGTFLTSTTNALGQQTLYTYTTAADAPQPVGLLKAMTDAGGQTTSYVYNVYGQLLIETNTAGQQMHYDYDALGRVVTTTDYSGRVTVVDYDPAGQVVTSTVNYLAGQVQNYLNQYNLIMVNDYDGAGRLRWTRDTYNRTDWTCYDAAGRVNRTVQNASGNGLTPATDPCNAASYVASSDLAYDRVATTIYDNAGNVSATIDAAGIVSRSYFDGSNRPYLSVQNFTGSDLTGTITSTIPAWTASYPDRNVRSQTVYDAAGNVVKTIDNAGLVSVTCYDALNRPIKTVQNPTVADPCVAYTPSGAPDQDLTETTSYDENGNAIATADALGRVTRTWYDVLNRPITVTVNYTGNLSDPSAPAYNAAQPDRNLTTETFYDAAGRAYKTVDGVSGRTDWTCYDAAGRVTRSVQNAPGDPCGTGWSPSSVADQDVATSYTYEATTGRQIAVTAADGQITRTYFDADGRQVAQTANLTGQAIAVATVPTYNPAFPDQNVTTRWSYDALGRTITTTVAAGSVQAQTTYTCYDALGRVAKTILNPTVANPCVSYTLSSQTDRDVVTTFAYDAAGNTIATTDALGHITRTFYDGLNRTVAVASNLMGQGITVTTVPAYDAAYPDRNVRVFTSYDAAGRVVESTDNTGLVTRSTYDGVGRTITTTVNYQSGGPVNDTTNLASGTAYDKLGNVTRSLDPKGVVTGFDYDWAGRVITVTENLVIPGVTTGSQNVRTGYAYDGRGNRLSITDGRGKLTTFTYDGLDRQKTETDALNHTWTTSYSKVGLRVSLLDANGQTTSFLYDGLRRETTIDYPAGTADVSFTYDALGNRATMTDGTGSTSWTLDALNRPLTITAPSGAVGYGYDRLGNRTTLRYPDTKTVTYTVDALSRIASVQDWTSQFTSYTYNAAGQVVTTTLPNGVRTVYGYDAAQRLQTLTHSTLSQTLGAYTYTVDASGNRTAVTESLMQDVTPLNVVDPIFANGFENGTTLPGAWSGTTGTGVSVTSTSPITGTYSLLVTPSGTTARYITDTLPTAETRYRARFFMSTTALTMPTTITHTIFAAYSGTSTLTDTLSLDLRKLASGSYQVRAGSRLDSGALQQTGWVTVTNGIHWLELDWQAASAAGANNGKLDWWVDSAAQTGLTGQDSDTRRIDSARLGVVAVAGSGTVSGSYRFDAFESRRATGPIGSVVALPDALFGDSFETGNTAFWQTSVITGGAVTTTAAMVGSQGLSIPLTSATTAKYLEDPTPGAESRYRARFYFDPNSLTMTNATSHTVMVGYTSTVSTNVFEVALQKVAAGYQLRVQNRDNASVWQVSPWVTITDDKHAIEIDWQSGASGSLNWWIDGAAQTAPAAVNNSARKIDLVRIGAVSGVDATTLGSFFLDGFESRRSSAIGLAVTQAIVTKAITYGYDPLYRLTSALYNDGTQFGYQYDAVGNVLTKTQTIAGTAATQTYAYDDANRQTSAAGLTQTYDNNGNLLNDGTTAYTWDGANRMTASGATAYVYNGLNDRVSVAGVAQRLDLNAGLTQVLADGTSSYLYGAGRLGELQGTGWQYHLADGLGSVRQLATASGVVATTRYFEPFGRLLTSTGSSASAYGWSGESQNGTSVYLRARTYSAVIERFMSKDKADGNARAPQSLNSWVYASANPILYVDPTGNTRCTAQGGRTLKPDCGLREIEGNQVLTVGKGGERPGTTPWYGSEVQALYARMKSCRDCWWSKGHNFDFNAFHGLMMLHEIGQVPEAKQWVPIAVAQRLYVGGFTDPYCRQQPCINGVFNYWAAISQSVHGHLDNFVRADGDVCAYLGPGMRGLSEPMALVMEARILAIRSLYPVSLNRDRNGAPSDWGNNIGWVSFFVDAKGTMGPNKEQLYFVRGDWLVDSVDQANYWTSEGAPTSQK